MVNSYGWKTVRAPGFQRAKNRYFDIKWRLFRIFGTTRRLDKNAERLPLRARLERNRLND
ncbi:hypothetical protein [Caballeronia sordidicola]|uniref:hypothetical protein n=1 Tax=Caballeronia sordidicola TaxID=196367 RepID=UPI0004D027C3|nr:hypothetical protein [Caballeronia sordidicola]